MTGHILLYHPAFIKLQQLIKNGYIGKLKQLYSIRVGYKFNIVDDITWDYAPHDISMIQKLITYNVKFIKVLSSKKTKKITEINIKLVYKSNIAVKIFLSWNLKNKIQQFKVIGTKKMLIFNDINCWNNKLQVYNNKNKYLFNIKVFKKEPLLNQCQYFISSVKNRKKILTSSQNSEKTIKLIETLTTKVTLK